ncbi:hypothetical protein [Aliikangiella coralliicola]|uniref:Uncharacterized protein n=1 Tax=Aliikangiella coralliicola TaxID=2592383 RepID=A0A545U4W0_9GAMM|nr:hypothetical protein [Aliikangiella coralliicola]TQV84510.1 hypothetical protein FLL46_23130 [Aliikangiella coralliicola]
MKKILEAIEKLGCGVSFDEDFASLDKVLGDIELSDDEISALKSGDRAQLEQLLGTRSKIVCMLVPAKDDDDEDQDSDDKGDDKDSGESNIVVNF